MTVIDADVPGLWKEFRAELTSMGRTIDDVKGVILTHGDSDHVGFAERLRRDHGVPVYVHSADAARAKGGPKPKNPAPPMKLLPTLGFLAYTVRKGGIRTAWLTEVVEIEHGETLDLPGRPGSSACRATPPAASRCTFPSPTPSSSATGSPPGTS